jgi:glyoxylase-like metal-dependent hydrolase (beta-lactamase superfamily II)
MEFQAAWTVSISRGRELIIRSFNVILEFMTGSTKLIHEILPVGMLQCNCHILGDPETREALVIDPGDEAGRILDVIDRLKLRVSAIVLTHAHIDHVGALARVQQVTGAPVQMHVDDLDLYKMLDVQAAWIGWDMPGKVEVGDLLREGDTIRWGRFQARVLHTPGHSEGGICLYMPPPDITDSEARAAAAAAGKSIEGEPGLLFSGDTLFAGSIGRTDLWGGSLEAINRSLRDKLLELPDETIVYPGHGEATTIGRERETNPFLVGH